MTHYELIYVLDDGTEITHNKISKEDKLLFPPDISQKIKPYIEKAYKKNPDDWSYSIIKVYTTGIIEPIYNLPPKKAFNVDL